jgi:hypothetical protein
MAMNALMRRSFPGRFGLLAAFGAAQAQPPSGAEARLKEKNIALPPEAAPFANFVNALRVGNLLFMAGNTGRPHWAGKHKVGRDLTAEQGYPAAQGTGLIMLSKVRGALGSLDRVKRVVDADRSKGLACYVL